MNWVVQRWGCIKGGIKNYQPGVIPWAISRRILMATGNEELCLYVPVKDNQCWEIVVTNRFIVMREEWWCGIWKTGLWTVRSGNTKLRMTVLLSLEYMTTETHWLLSKFNSVGTETFLSPYSLCLQVFGINRLLGRNIPHIDLCSDFISYKKRRN